MQIRRSIRIAAVAAATLGLAAGTPATSALADPQSAPITLSAEPDRLKIVGLPCLPGIVKVGMTNTGDSDAFADMTLTPESPLELNRQIFSSWVPARDPDATVTTPVRVTAPQTTKPGDYRLTLASGRSRLSVPIEVRPLPSKKPGDNLALGELASASSVNGTFPGPCGAVDGDKDTKHWASRATGWADGTRDVFPDTYEVALAEPTSISRVELYTMVPAATVGLRDWNVEVRTNDAWATVAEVRGNIVAQVTSTFPAVTADAVRITTLDSNDHAYSRIMELEVY